MKSLKLKYSILVIILLGLCSCSGLKQGKAQNLQSDIQVIESNLLPGIRIDGSPMESFNLKDRMDFYKVPGFSIAIVKGGELVEAKAYGTSDASGNIPLDINTLFQAASISKPISALGVLLLVQAGKVKLDVDINQYLTSWKVDENEFTNQEKVTIRRLLSHTAGIRDRGFDGYTQEEQIPSTTQVLNGEGNTERVSVSSVPGMQRRYSGGGYVILQQMIEDQTGMPFDIYMEKEVLKPLGMIHSTYQQPLSRGEYKNVSNAHNREGETIQGGWHNYPEKAPGGLWTTPSDYAKYCIAMHKIHIGGEESILNQKMLSIMLTKHLDDWGLGPVIKGEGESLRLTHDGSNKGFKADFTAFMNTGDAIVMLSNGDNGGSLGNEFVRAASAHYNWGTHDQRLINSPDLSGKELQKFVGNYAWTGNRNYRIEVTIDDGSLNFIAPGDYGPRILKLTPFGELDFIDLNSEVEIRFQSSGLNQISGLLERGRNQYEKIEE